MKSIRWLSSALRGRPGGAAAGPSEGPAGATAPDLAAVLPGVDLPVPLRGIPAEADGEPVPDELFDRRFYRRLYPDAGDRAPREHFAAAGRAEGRAPSAGAVYLVDAIRLAARDSATPMADLVSLLPPDQRRRAGGHVPWDRLWRSTHPEVYAAQLDAAGTAELEALVDDGLSRVTATVTHFLVHGAAAGLRPGALFQEDWYLSRLSERGLVVPEGTIPFFHWLTVGWDERIVPTPLFDEEFYRDRHPSIAAGRQWGFGHYLLRGCYAPSWQPSPTGRHHDGAADPRAQAEQRPLLVTQLLHRASDFDLRRTSWLEEGQQVVLARRDRFLASPRVAELVAKVAAIEPLVHEPRRTQLSVSLAPYRQNRVHLYSRAEEVRRALGSRAHDAVLLVPGDDERITVLADTFEKAILERSPEASVLRVATDAAPRDDAFDLVRFTPGMTTALQTDLLLDLVRGVEATRVVTIGSDLGWELLRAYVRQLSVRAALGGVLLTGGSTEQDAAQEARIVEECFPRMDWLLLDDADRRTSLVDRFVLPASSRRRLLAFDPATPANAIADALDTPRRSA